MLPRNRLLVYAQDPGGGKYISPVIQELIKSDKFFDPAILVHPLSQGIFNKIGIPYVSLEKCIGKPPLSENTWESFLAAKGITHVFCTTSSPYLDLTNCNLVTISKKLNIPVMGILDHWKGFDRFFSENKPIYFPDYICCIDEFCKCKFEDMDLPVNNVYAVGHPYLEKIAGQNWEQNDSGWKIRVLLISQPNTVDRSFKGIFFLQIGKKRLIDEIASQMTLVFHNQTEDIHIRYRLHPKEEFIETLPEGVKLDDNREWAQTMKANDIFLGLDSMALVEAHLAGKYCISLSLPELESLSDNSIPISFPGIVNDISDLSSVVEGAIGTIREGAKTGNRYTAIFSDSTQRVLSLIDRFFQGKLS
jgi:hypothetical protein